MKTKDKERLRRTKLKLLDKLKGGYNCNFNFKNKIISKYSNKTSDDSSISEYPNIYLTSSSKTNTDKDNFSEIIQKKNFSFKKYQFPRCSLWKDTLNDRINVSTLYTINKTKTSISSMNPAYDVTLKQISRSKTKTRNATEDHILKHTMKNNFLSRTIDLKTIDHSNIKNKLTSVKCILNFWKGVMDSSFPIILADKIVQKQKNVHRYHLK